MMGNLIHLNNRLLFSYVCCDSALILIRVSCLFGGTKVSDLFYNVL